MFVLSDDGEDGIAADDRFADRLDEVLPRLDRVDVEEDVARIERVAQSIEQTPGIRRAVVSAIADENSGHVTA